MSRFLLLCWRDSAHPQGGGSERYLEHIASYLAAAGHEVIFRTARPSGSARSERRDGIQFSRGGGRLSVYPRAWFYIWRERLRARRHGQTAFDAVIDTQNGVPFFAAAFSGAPTLVLSHHCHREQWPVAGPLLSRVGWWIESRLSPRLHRHTQWVTVSLPSAEELANLGVPESQIAVIRNGIDPLPAGVTAGSAASRAPGPRLVALSRLVPHKHVEDALNVLAELLPQRPELRLDVVGSGWWAAELTALAQRLGVAHAVDFHGHVDERRKHEILAAATVHLMPSRKEGWGLAVMEAAQHGVPTIGYWHAAGLRDSIIDGETGILVTDRPAMARATAALLDDTKRCEALGEAARTRAAGFSWSAAGASMRWLLQEVAADHRHAGVIRPPSG